MDEKDLKLLQELKKDAAKSKQVLTAGESALKKFKTAQNSIKVAKGELVNEED